MTETRYAIRARLVDEGRERTEWIIRESVVPLDDIGDMCGSWYGMYADIRDATEDCEDMRIECTDALWDVVAITAVFTMQDVADER